MKVLCLVFSLLYFACSFAQSGSTPKKTNGRFSLPPGISGKDYRPGVLIVKFKPTVSTGDAAKTAAVAVPSFSLSTAKILSVTKKFADAPTTATTSSTARSAANDVGLNRIYEVKFSGKGTITDLINELLQDPRIEYAEPDYIYHQYYAPNDTRYLAGGQAYLDLVKAPQAWDLLRNSSGVVIAIIDSGSDLTHEDLAANIYLNTADPVNGIDDDRDGYVDNYSGWDLIGASASRVAEDNDPNVKSDSTEHGVHVSGLAGAVTNNGIGIAGVGFNPKLLIVKCGADDNASSIYRGYEGIKYAADHGAQIINCSWGGSVGGSFGLDMVTYAQNKGCLLVAAAGNDNVSTSDYPAAYPGVISVANVTINETKANSSNFGTNVSISAPGTSLLSTLRSNRYGTLSGTSMASPIVAAAAALVKSYFPQLTMQQVGERLRATADNIDAKNPNYAGLLGKGRLNVYRALFETPVAVRYQKITLADKGNGNIPAGDTLTLYFDLKSVLEPVSGLQIALSSANTNVVVTAASQSIANLGTNQSQALVGPFKVYIKPTIATNALVQFKLTYTGNGGAYVDSENFSLNVALDYLNISVNNVWTTMTSNGRVGYSQANTTGGQGLIFNNQNLLYEASLMIGNSGSRISDNARSVNGWNEHFVKTVAAKKIPGSTAAFEGHAEFDDSGNPLPVNILVKNDVVAFATAPDDKYVLVQYEVTNTTSNELNNVYVGMFTDFDIDNGTNNYTHYDAANRLAYIAQKGTGTAFAGVKLLSASAAPAYYPLSYQIAGDPLADDYFTSSEKFTTLSSGIKAAGLAETTSTGNDVMFVSGYGPYAIPARGSVKVAFAFLAGTSLSELQASANAAQNKYAEVFKEEPIAASLVLRQNYPNPVQAQTTIDYSVPKSGRVSLSLYDLGGKKVKTYLNELVGPGIHSLSVNTFDLQNGLYIYRLRYGKEEKALKMLVSK